MKKRFLMILIAICAISLCLSVSCGEKNKESTKNPSNATTQSCIIEGVTDIAISVSETEYNFLKGVVGWDGTTAKAVSVDSSAVQFGKVGEYEIIYTLEKVSKKATVRVYGLPEIVGDAEYEAHYSQDLDVFADITGKDSFGAELLVTTNQEFEKDVFGRVIYGEHFFRYYVTDTVGNTSYLDRTYTVKPPLGYDFEDVIVTTENPETEINIGDKVLNYIVYNGEKIPANAYFVKDGVLNLSYFAIDQGVRKQTYNLSFEGGYSDVVVDMQINARQYYGREIKGEDMLDLFYTYLGGETFGNCVEWDSQENAYHFKNYVTEQYDNRGFYIDVNYFDKILSKGGAVKMTFDMKFDSPKGGINNSSISHAFFLGFIPDWFADTSTRQQFQYAENYQSVTIDLTKVSQVDGKYRTLFMLSTIDGFYIKNIRFEFAN